MDNFAKGELIINLVKSIDNWFPLLENLNKYILKF